MKFKIYEGDPAGWYTAYDEEGVYMGGNTSLFELKQYLRDKIRGKKLVEIVEYIKEEK
jgi:hypothetical protein